MTIQPEKVLLIVPPTGKFIREDRCQTPIEELKTVALRPPINLMYAAAAFEQAGCHCQIKDYPAENQAWTDFRRDIVEFKPDVLVISATTPSLQADLEAARIAKEINPPTKTIAKGAHFNVRDLETLGKFPYLDGCFRGEYELTCLELGQGRDWEEILGLSFRTSQGELRQNPPRSFVEDLDQLPFPARHLIKNELYFRPDTMTPQTTLITNRGCPFDCIFCLATQVAGLKNRVRSVDNVVSEIKRCISQHKIRNFLFRSDLFTANRNWVIDLCQRIIKEKLNIEWACNSRVDTLDEEMLRWMKKAHCWLIAFGVEKANQEMLDKMNKKVKVEDAINGLKLTRQAGIKSSIYFLFGLPWDTPETLQADIEFAKQLEPDFLEIFYVYPFPGTPLYELAAKEGLVKQGEYPKEAYSQPAMPTLHMSKEELRGWRRKALRHYYLRPDFILKTLARNPSPRVFFNYFRYGFIQLLDLLTHK